MSSQGKKVKTIHDALKPLYFVSRLQCMWPYKYEKFNKIVPLSAKDKLISYLLSIYIAINFSLLFYQYVITLMVNFRIIDFVILPFFLFEETLAIISILRSARCDHNKSFFFLLDGLNRYGLFHTLENNTIRNKIVRHIAILFSLTFANIIMIMTMTNATGFLVLCSFYVAQLIRITFFIQVISKMQILILYLQKVNAGILEITGSKSVEKDMVEFIERDECKLNRLSGLLRAHGQICNLIKVINDCDGAQLVLSYCSTVLLNLFCLYGCIVDTKKAFKNDISWGRATVAMCERIYNFIFINMMIVALASNSTRLKNEAAETEIISGDVLNDMAVENELCEYRKTCKKKLKTFLKQVAFRNTQVTGAGIFMVNFTIISSIVAAVTSYFIVILQFKED